MVGVTDTQQKKKRGDVVFEGHLGKKMVDGQGKVAERIRGHWRIGGSEPYKVCEEDEEWVGSRNLRLVDSGLRHMENVGPGSTALMPEKDVVLAV